MPDMTFVYGCLALAVLGALCRGLICRGPP